MKTQVIMPTAGLGLRMGSSIPKPFLEINHKPLFIYALEAFDRCKCVESVVLVIAKELQQKFQEALDQFKIQKVKALIPGGDTRCESVSNGLSAIDLDTQIVIVHDGARPFVTQQMIDEVYFYCCSNDACIVAVEVKSTIKEVDAQNHLVKKTLDRNLLWDVQTPQGFKKDILIQAHQQENKNSATDDASLVEQLGIDVKVIKGNYQNLKVTTLEDLVLAEAFLSIQNGS